MKKPDLEVIYKKVKQRAYLHRCGDNPQRLEAAKAAASAAREIVRSKYPTLVAVNRFRELEERWLKFAQENAICYADVFEKAVRTGNYTNEPRHHGYGTGRADSPGTVYCWVSSAWPGRVKIGSITEATLGKREQLFERQHPGHNVRTVFTIQVQCARKVEGLAQRELKDRGLRVPGPGLNGNKSSEWFKVDVRTAEQVIRNAANDVDKEESGPLAREKTVGSSRRPPRLPADRTPAATVVNKAARRKSGHRGETHRAKAASK